MGRIPGEPQREERERQLGERVLQASSRGHTQGSEGEHPNGCPTGPHETFLEQQMPGAGNSKKRGSESGRADRNGSRRQGLQSGPQPCRKRDKEREKGLLGRTLPENVYRDRSLPHAEDLQRRPPGREGSRGDQEDKQDKRRSCETGSDRPAEGRLVLPTVRRGFSRGEKEGGQKSEQGSYQDPPKTTR